MSGKRGEGLTDEESGDASFVLLSRQRTLPTELPYQGNSAGRALMIYTQTKTKILSMVAHTDH